MLTWNTLNFGIMYLDGIFHKYAKKIHFIYILILFTAENARTADALHKDRGRL